MKGFVGIVLAFVPELCRRDLKVPIHIAISYDEELGCTGVLSLVDRIREFPVSRRYASLANPPACGSLGHKSGTEHIVTVKGTAAHSSLAPRAVNAIAYAAELITFIHEIGREFARPATMTPSMRFRIRPFRLPSSKAERPSTSSPSVAHSASTCGHCHRSTFLP